MLPLLLCITAWAAPTPAPTPAASSALPASASAPTPPNSAPVGHTGPMGANSRSTLIHPSPVPSPTVPANILTAEPYVRISGTPVPSASATPGASGDAAPIGKTPDTDPRFAAGDAAFLLRADEAKAREALRIYRSLFADRKTDPEAGWRLAMGCYFVGLRLTQSEDDKKQLFSEGQTAGQAGIDANPRCAPCFFWTSINIALYGEASGVFKQVFQLNTVKEMLKTSIALDPKYAYSGAYRLLGTIEQKLPGILGGSNSRAREFFEKAVSSSPDEPLNYLFLARLLANDLKNPQEGIEVAKRGLKVPPPGPDRVEANEALGDLREFIAQTEKK